MILQIIATQDYLTATAIRWKSNPTHIPHETRSPHPCIESTQRRHFPSCIRSKALLISPRVKLWVMYSSTLISCKTSKAENILSLRSLFLTLPPFSNNVVL